MEEIKRITIFKKNKRVLEIEVEKSEEFIYAYLTKIFDITEIKERLGWGKFEFNKVKSDLYLIQQVLDLYAPSIHSQIENLYKVTLKREKTKKDGVISFKKMKIRTSVEEIRTLVREIVRKYGGTDQKKKGKYCLYPKRARGKKDVKSLRPLICIDAESTETAKENPKIKDAEKRAHIFGGK